MSYQIEAYKIDRISPALRGLGTPPHEDRLPRIQGQRRVQHEIGIRQPPRPDLHWLVLDSGRGHAKVKLVVVLDASVNQGLDRGLLLKISNEHHIYSK